MPLACSAVTNSMLSVSLTVERTVRVTTPSGIRHGEQQDLVELGNARLVPVVSIARELQAFARHDAIDLEWSGAGRLQRDLDPVPAELVPLRRARIEDVGHVVGKQRVDDAGRQLDRVLIDRLVAHEGRNAGAGLRHLLAVELRGLVVQDLVEVPDDGVSVEVGAVVELYAFTQLEDPFGRFAFDRRPRKREAGTNIGDGVGL